VHQQIWGYKLEEKIYLGVHKPNEFEYHLDNNMKLRQETLRSSPSVSKTSLLWMKPESSRQTHITQYPSYDVCATEMFKMNFKTKILFTLK
jgi:hypothetical protein